MVCPLFVRDRFVVVMSFVFNVAVFPDVIISYSSLKSFFNVFFLRKIPSGIIITLRLVIT
jgi:hypothetical protein